MKKNIFIIALLTGCCSLSAWAQKQEKTITVEVNNNWNRAKTDEPVVINLHDLHTGFKVKSAVVMEGSTEIPSQLDDLNRDRKMDELAFVTSLPAHGRKSFQVTLSSEKSTKTYPARVYAESINRCKRLLCPAPATYTVWFALMVRYWNRNW